ncbi:MAG: hypothetical protein CVV24_09850 [Ignavibacteriae bacterium HGW-Ignavibacteriae-3]|nr:MAG: hypothetical protein CVV24_09850 [Ignavibacteriae bacterium HGW-Ignavibacteriae-3]
MFSNRHHIISSLTISNRYLLQRNFLLIVLILFLALSCAKIPDGIVEPLNADYSVIAVTAPSAVNYLPNDSSVVASVRIINTSSVSRVWCKVSSLDGLILIAGQVILYDDGNVSGNGDQAKGDGIYSGKFVMGKLKPKGKYQIEFFVENNIQQPPANVKKVGAQIFNFDNIQINLAPVIANLILASSVNRGDSFIFSIKVTDPNGLTDIMQVYFKLYRPDGSPVLNGTDDYFLMVDNGDLNFGDQTGGDGIYSFKNSFGLTAPTGSWKFEFGANDRGGLTSNILIQNVMVN